MARTHTQIKAENIHTHAQMPPSSAACHRPEDQGVCVGSTANKQLVDTQVSFQPYGVAELLFARDELHASMIFQCQPAVGESVYLRQGTKTVLDTSSCDSSAGTGAALSFGCSYTGKNIIHMFCITARVASSSFLLLSRRISVSAGLVMWLSARNRFFKEELSNMFFK